MDADCRRFQKKIGREDLERSLKHLSMNALTPRWFLPTLEEKILPALGERVQDDDPLASPLLFPFSVQISLHVQDAVWSKAAIQLDVATEPSLSPC